MVCLMWELSVSSDLFAWVILPLLIFSARICDVSLGTLRVIFISRGFKKIAPFIGFFEVIIWLVAIGQVMQNIGNFASYIAYGREREDGEHPAGAPGSRLCPLRQVHPRVPVALATRPTAVAKAIFRRGAQLAECSCSGITQLLASRTFAMIPSVSRSLPQGTPSRSSSVGRIAL